jgi:polysaccharide deacetylase family protein (PEP-CTERM system associated)
VTRSLFLASFDVEDWFHAENVKGSLPEGDEASLEARVERNTHGLLDILAETGAKSTFFVLGWVARRHPALVARIAADGHELASHADAHRNLYALSRKELVADLVRARETLEDLSGQPVRGLRAPNFSISDEVLECLAEAGYWYDASFYAFKRHDRYGQLSAAIDPDAAVVEIAPGLLELPMTRLRIGPLALPWSGGAYFRVIPYRIFRLGVARTLRSRTWFMFYFHPWELDAEEAPPAGLAAIPRLRGYAGRKRMRADLRRLLGEFGSERIDQALASIGYEPPS